MRVLPMTLADCSSPNLRWSRASEKMAGGWANTRILGSRSTIKYFSAQMAGDCARARVLVCSHREQEECPPVLWWRNCMKRVCALTRESLYMMRVM